MTPFFTKAKAIELAAAVLAVSIVVLGVAGMWLYFANTGIGVKGLLGLLVSLAVLWPALEYWRATVLGWLKR